MTRLVVNQAVMQAGDVTVVDKASFEIAEGECVALLGPNGAGKSTLLRGALGLQKLLGGSSHIDADDTASMSPSNRALKVAYLPQARAVAWPSPVRDIVALGRFAHGAAVGRLRGEDLEAVNAAIAGCGLQEFAQRPMHQLSGGEQARVHCARAVASQAPLLVADEPVASLDPYHQQRIMSVIQSFVLKGGGALVVLHDVSLACQFADRLIWMVDGRIIADGSPEETLSEERMAQVYGVSTRIDGRHVNILEAL